MLFSILKKGVKKIELYGNIPFKGNNTVYKIDTHVL